jgi:hypothetical protein
MSMMVWGLTLVGPVRPGQVIYPRPGEWLALLTGALAVLSSFLCSYAALAVCHHDLTAKVGTHVPSNYPWWLLALGLALLWAGFVSISGRKQARKFKSRPTDASHR